MRRHLLLVVAVVMAIAAGVALGAGPLSDLGKSAPRAAAEPGPSHQEQPSAAKAFADQFAGDVAANLYGGRLHAHPVVLLTMPGADPDVVSSITDQVRLAGTQVIATYAVKRRLVDPEEKTLADTLGLQLVKQLGDGVVTSDATTYDRIGQLIGKAVSATSRSAAMDQAKIASLRASLKGAGFLGLPDGDPNVAPLVLVVTGKEVAEPVIDGLAAGLAAVAKGVVVAGPTGDPGIAALRAQPPGRPVVTVDGTDTVAGRVTTVLGLVQSLAGAGGSFGASGSDGAVPLG